MRLNLLLFLYCLMSHPAVAQQEEIRLSGEEVYFPPPDSLGGWRTLTDARDIQKIAGMDLAKLHEAFEFVRTSTKNGGLLVVRKGWLVYEQYFGLGQREATPNLGSCGKSFTSIAVGILMNKRPDLFPEGLDQKIFRPGYLPSKAFPLPDARMADIKLGQLLAFSAGIRGNNPVYVYGKSGTIDPAGPDGWQAMVDDYALGLEEGHGEGRPFSTRTLWCEPGEGYSYASASIHIASIMLRHIEGVELQTFLQSAIAEPLGWGRWGFGYRNYPLVKHTPGAGGIALRSTDMLRFVYLLLREGKWEEQQIVPIDFVRQASRASSYNPHFPYSLQFNVNTNGEQDELPRDAFWKTGSGGHCFYVVPSLDLVVWKLGGRDGQYSRNNTHLPEPELLPGAIPATDEVSDDYHNYIITLVKVIEAIE